MDEVCPLIEEWKISQLSLSKFIIIKPALIRLWSFTKFLTSSFLNSNCLMFLLLKLNGKEIKPEDQEMIDRFGDVLSFLSFKYKEKVKSN